jgi:uncharacterized phage protein gp47/JayE
MTILTATDFANQIVAQARVLDPSFSGEVGTPERKMIDAVSQALANAQVDLTGLSGAMDIDSQYGSNLDRFVALFGFQRQVATAATGYVNFGTTNEPIAAISIPATTILQGSVPTSEGQILQYTTQAGGTIPTTSVESGAIPIQCSTTGSAGNAAANTITVIVQTTSSNTTLSGVTSVTNSLALTNGTDQETDNALKTRFKNTWARNLAGTSDQYLALAVAGTYTTMANVIGSQSRYQEYIQVPDYDDAGYLNGAQTQVQDTYGTPNQWTTAQSDIPYCKYIYTDTQAYIEDASQDYYYRNGTDFQFNNAPLLFGDMLRDQPNAAVTGPSTVNSSSTLLYLSSYAEFPAQGSFVVVNPVTTTASVQGSYTSLGGYVSGSGWVLEGITWSSTFTAASMEGYPLYVLPAPTLAPNFTFLNISNANIDGLQSLSPGEIVISEYSYVSTASRNDPNHAVTNAVDVYVNGANDTAGSCIFLPQNPLPTFVSAPNSKFYYENFRRDGNWQERPIINNYITPLFNAPLDSLPAGVTINNQNYFLGTHYWLVHEIGFQAGSISARDGIEWDAQLGGDTVNDTAPVNTLAPYNPTGTVVSALGTNIPIEVDNYLFDANIVTLQANMNAACQITTNVLVHQAKQRYFKLDVTVMYTTNANPAAVNASIGTAVQAYFANQYFGAVIQISELLGAIYNVSGVANVRWSNDLPIAPDAIRVLECDVNGNPLQGASVQRVIGGNTTPATTETQRVFIVGGGSQYNAPGTGGGLDFGPNDSFTLTWTDPALDSGTPVSASINLSLLNALNFNTNLQTAIRNAMIAAGVVNGVYYNITVTQDTRATINVVNPMLSFTIQYGATGPAYVPSVTNSITASAFAYDSDFFLLDNELPNIPTNALTTDTVPGLIIRTRAQNTWLRPGLG